MQALIGHSIHELHLYARWDGSPYHFIETGIFQTLKQGTSKQSDSDVFWRNEGDHFAVSWNCTRSCAGGEVQGAVLAFRDITQRKRQEHQLREALAEVERLRDRLQAENAYLQAEVKTEDVSTASSARAPRSRRCSTRSTRSHRPTVRSWSSANPALARRRWRAPSTT